MVEPTDPGGYVVILFGSASDGCRELNKCPMDAIWFADHTAAERYMDTLPQWTEPHCLPLNSAARGGA